MKHVKLTCKNHPALRWHCKAIAYTEGVGYNGTRHIFFSGREGKPDTVADWKVIGGEIVNIHECDCPSTDLIKVK